MTIMKKRILLFLSILAAITFSACQHEEDPFVDRVVSPVLIVFDNAIGDGGGQTAEPTVTSKVAGSVTLRLRVYQLDKTNILNSKGIDSVAVSSLALKLTTRTGTPIADLTTDAKGVATVTKTWSEFGLAAPRAGNTVSLSLMGSHSGQSFTRLARLQAVN
jgi:hypothetical protein